MFWFTFCYSCSAQARKNGDTLTILPRTHTYLSDCLEFAVSVRNLLQILMLYSVSKMLHKIGNIVGCLSVSDGVEVEYDAVDAQVCECEATYASDLLPRRVEPRKAGTRCVAQVLEYQLRNGSDAAMTPDVAGRRADAPRNFRSFGVVKLGLVVDGARRLAGTRRRPLPSHFRTKIRQPVRQQNGRRHGNETTHICSSLNDHFCQEVQLVISVVKNRSAKLPSNTIGCRATSTQVGRSLSLLPSHTCRVCFPTISVLFSQPIRSETVFRRQLLARIIRHFRVRCTRSKKCVFCTDALAQSKRSFCRRVAMSTQRLVGARLHRHATELGQRVAACSYNVDYRLHAIAWRSCSV